MRRIINRKNNSFIIHTQIILNVFLKISSYVFASHFFNLIFVFFKQIEFSCESTEDVDSWKAMFLRAGVYPESVSLDVNPLDDGSFGQNLDPILERQVETIRNLVDSYVRIETKKIKDQIPKIVTCMYINRLREFIRVDLLRCLIKDGEMLMEESPEEVRRREDLLRTYESLREALQIINEVNMTTTYVPPPPPLKNDWQPAPSIPSGNRHTMPGNSNSLTHQAKPSIPPAPSTMGMTNNSIPVHAAPIKPTQSVPPRPKPTPAAFVNHNSILQPTKAPVPLRPAPTIPPRR